MAAADDDLLLGPAKEVLDDQEKIEEAPQLDQEQEQQPLQEPPRRKTLRSLGVPQLIALYQTAAAAGGGNDDVLDEILELILEKGGPGAVRRALGRVQVFGDGHAGPDAPDVAPADPAQAADRAADPATDLLARLEERLGRAFLLAAVGHCWQQARGPGPDPAAADLDLVTSGPGFSLQPLLAGLEHALARAGDVEEGR
ncbi:MAG: hypothetical protein RBU45_17440 [Myxococcota bacterium]|jgi:hypothetical protein|nr:hypothetical protein [Myxococcota bacterium]